MRKVCYQALVARGSEGMTSNSDGALVTGAPRQA